MADATFNDRIMRDLPFELKELREDGTFEGIANVLGVEDLGGDIIERGAFQKTIADNPIVPVLWQHKPDEVIGQGEISEKSRNVLIRGKLDLDDPTGAKAYRKLKNKLVRGLSIGFTATKYRWQELKGRTVRMVEEVRLWEVSIVTFPMNEGAMVTAVKSQDKEDPGPAATVSELVSRIDLLEQKIQSLQANPTLPPESMEKSRQDRTEPTEQSTKPVGDHSALLETASLIRSFTNGSK